MKKIIAISGAIVILICTLTSCSMTTVQITPENFEQYFGSVLLNKVEVNYTAEINIINQQVLWNRRYLGSVF